MTTYLNGKAALTAYGESVKNALKKNQIQLISLADSTDRVNPSLQGTRQHLCPYGVRPEENLIVINYLKKENKFWVMCIFDGIPHNNSMIVRGRIEFRKLLGYCVLPSTTVDLKLAENWWNDKTNVLFTTYYKELNKNIETIMAVAKKPDDAKKNDASQTQTPSQNQEDEDQDEDEGDSDEEPTSKKTKFIESISENVCKSVLFDMLQKDPKVKHILDNHLECLHQNQKIADLFQ